MNYSVNLTKPKLKLITAWWMLSFVGLLSQNIDPMFAEQLFFQHKINFFVAIDINNNTLILLSLSGNFF